MYSAAKHVVNGRIVILTALFRMNIVQVRDQTDMHTAGRDRHCMHTAGRGQHCMYIAGRVSTAGMSKHSIECLQA